MPVKMILQKGRVPVKVYTDDIEHEALEQLINISKLPVVHGHVAAMPDVHAGIGATVGSVIPTRGAIIPAAVGVDIGCGMNAVRLTATASDLPDSLAKIRAVLDDLAITNAYIHADAALSGLILPFVDDPQPWDFAAGADSIAISGHKMLGSPLPSGVVLARKSHVDRIARSIEYIGALDTTISGSRSAFGPLFLWYRLRTLGREGLKAMVHRSLALAAYGVEVLRARGIDAWRNENSVTVVFPRPPESVMKKWIVAPRRGIGHIITMPHMTEDIIDEFVADFAAALASETQPHTP